MAADEHLDPCCLACGRDAYDLTYLDAVRKAVLAARASRARAVATPEEEALWRLVDG
jgi:hypothetical protein